MDVSPSSPDSSDVAPQSPVRTSPRKGTPFAPSTPQEIDQGMEVLVTRARGKIGRGKVKYIGYLPSKSDTVYLGLELDREGDFHKLAYYVFGGFFQFFLFSFSICSC